MNEKNNYVLGTDMEELKRLGFQHFVWRPYVMDVWNRAGITQGSVVADIGAGPGFASLDLVPMVGHHGMIYPIERSTVYLDHLRQIVNDGQLHNIEILDLDLMTTAMPSLEADFAWCRWVACFVSDPLRLVHNIHSILKPQGKIIFHEYCHYETYRLSPASAIQEEFVQHVMNSWRINNGAPNIARELPTYLADNGFKILSTKPIIFAARPHEINWHWPMSYVRLGSKRLYELGLVTEDWIAELNQEMDRYELNPNSIFTTPMVLEIVAEKI